MALVRVFKEKEMNMNSIHEEIEATFTTFERDGRKFLQVDTYGKSTRDMPGKKSQSIQLDEVGAERFFSILRSHFGFND
ncbi:MAG: methionyl-tRNA formyltransferase [Pseudomonadota bacterium]